MDTGLFFAGEPQMEALYRILEERMLARCGDFTVEVKRASLSLRNRYLFAWVTMRRRKRGPAEYIMLGFGLSFRAESPRLTQVSEPYPGRWTHHVRLSSEADIDDELMDWIAAAYGFAMIK